MLRRFFLCVIALLGVLHSVAHAENFNWKVTLNNGEEFSYVVLHALVHDSLYVARLGKSDDAIAVDSIAELRRGRGSAILPSVIGGAIVGAILGYSIKPVSQNESEANAYGGMFGGVLGGFAGYLFGSFIQPDDVFDFSRMTTREQKLEELNRLIRESNLK